MNRRVAALAAPTPPAADQLDRWGIVPDWSRHVHVPGHDGVTRRWHVLDRTPSASSTAGSSPPPVVCVHGNPTWAVMWGSFLDRLGEDRRVVAPDQLGMGYSDRTESPRSYAERVADLDDLISALDLDGPIVLAAHDWGGAIAMGWAVAHPERVAAIVLANTGIAVPAGRSAPAIIRLAAARGVHDLATRRTPLFVRGTGWLSRGRLTAVHREALVAPYRGAAHRRAVGDFVADIPFTPAHPSAAAIDAVAQGISDLDMPVLLAWGGRDPVFDDDFAADLLGRFRHAHLHRWPGGGHLVVPESTTGRLPGSSVADVAATWLAAVAAPEAPAEIDTVSPDAAQHGTERLCVSLGRGAMDDPGPTTPSAGTSDAGSASASSAAPGSDGVWRPIWAAIDERRDDTGVAFHDGASGRSITFAELHRMVHGIGAGLERRGIGRGDRIALLVPPSPELLALVYACWRIGAVTVIADRGLGLGGLGRAVRGARVGAVIGPRTALAAARTMRWAPSADTIDLRDVITMTEGAVAAGAATRGVEAGGAEAGAGEALPEPPGPDDLAAVLFTSGATGPAKGVRYTHDRLAGQREALTERYGIGFHDRFVAAFAPFALYGPALGITSAVPDVDVTAPGALTAEALDRSCAAIDATMVFASPAALANVVRTADAPLPALAQVRTIMSAGAPVPIRTLRAVSALAPAASLCTPYGMTEVLPVADIELAEIEQSLRAVPAPAEPDPVEPDPADPAPVGHDGSDGHEPPGRGVCVGHPVPGCHVIIAPLDLDPERELMPVDTIGRTGEVMVRSPWMSAGYDGLWHTQRSARPLDAEGREWHRSGDVGHIDHGGRLWIEGRSVHVIHTVDGPLTPVPIEVAVEAIDGVARAAAVGVGPRKVQQLVVVVEPRGRSDGGRLRRRMEARRDGLADLELTTAVRDALAPLAVAAVCLRTALPVDIRHNAKIDRTALAIWAADLLAGSGS